MAACISRYEDPAAAGEADIRARALAAGWRHDAVGRLVCPRCQQRNPGLWAACPVARQDHTPARGSGQHPAHARAGRISAVRAALSAWHRRMWDDLDRLARWSHLLAALAAGGNGWNTPLPSAQDRPRPPLHAIQREHKTVVPGRATHLWQRPLNPPTASEAARAEPGTMRSA